MGKTRSEKKHFSALRASDCSENKGGGPPTPPLDPPLLTHSISPSLVGRKVEIKRRHSTLSLALACASPFGLRFASSKSHLLQLFHRCSPPGGFWLPLFLFSVGVHLKANLGSLSIGILRTWPVHCSLLFFGETHCLSSYKFLISELVGQVDFSNLAEAALMKDIDLSHISLRYRPKLRAI